MSGLVLLQKLDFDEPPAYFHDENEKSIENKHKSEEKNDILKPLPNPPSYDEFSKVTLDEIIKKFREFMKHRFAIIKDKNVDNETEYEKLKLEFEQLCECEAFIRECRQKYITTMQDLYAGCKK